MSVGYAIAFYCFMVWAWRSNKTQLLVLRFGERSSEQAAARHGLQKNYIWIPDK